MQNIQNLVKKHWLWLIANVYALLLVVQLNLLLTAPFYDANRKLLALTGRAALILLILSLACTPLATFLGFRKALTVRKSLGLWAFFYAGMHFWLFLAQDADWQWETAYLLIRYKTAYAQAGLAAFILLLPLALTSTKWAMRRLGRNWKRIHRLVYLAVPLAVVHYWWRNLWFKFGDVYDVVPYAFIVALLLLLRVPQVRRYLRPLQNRVKRWYKPQFSANR